MKTLLMLVLAMSLGSRFLASSSPGTMVACLARWVGAA